MGALTSKPYRFRARPWDIEEAGSVCTLCPSQCNVEFTVRDEKVMRVLSRDPEHPGVDDGWLCDKGRFAYQSIHVDERITVPLVRDGGELREVSWERALQTAAGLGKHRGKVGTLVGGQASNEEGFLLGRLSREALHSEHIDCRFSESLALDAMQALADPGLQATVPDLEFAHSVLVLGCEPLDESPILDLRIRKGVRRRRVRLAVATPRPSALDANAQLVVRCPPGGEGQLLDALARGEGELFQWLRDGGEDIVVVWGERIGAAAALLPGLADQLGLRDRPGAGLIEIPAATNARGLREAGVLPFAGPGYAERQTPGRGGQGIARGVLDGEITALHLFAADPIRDHPDRGLWERALHHAGLVVAHAPVLTDGLREHADVVFPAESYAEKEGTVVHPDGRLQRLRTAIAHPGQVRAGWWVIGEIARRAGVDLGVLTSGMAWAQLAAAVPFYEGITLEQIGGRGLRWPELNVAAAFSSPYAAPDSGASARAEVGAGAGTGAGAAAQAGAGLAAQVGVGLAAQAGPAGGRARPGSFRLGTYRPIWAAPEVEISPALKFAIAEQQAELSPEDARSLGVSTGDPVAVSQNGTRVQARALVRSGVPAGTVFLAEGIAADSANELTQPLVEVTRS